MDKRVIQQRLNTFPRFDTFTRFVTFLRWITAAIGLGWAIILFNDLTHYLGALVLIGYAAFRSYVPLDYRASSRRAAVGTIVEIAIALATIIPTGGWNSPFMFCAFVPLVASGLSFGAYAAITVAVIEVAALMFSIAVTHPRPQTESIITWAGELFLVAVVASYGRTLLSRAEVFSKIVERRSRQLEHANSLLGDLDKLSRDSSVTFDSRNVVANAINQLQDNFDADAHLILFERKHALNNERQNEWEIAIARGIHTPRSISFRDLPQPAREAAITRQATVATDAENLFDQSAKQGLYVPLLVRGSRIGLVAMERRGEHRFNSNDEVDAVEFGEFIALSVDNARAFERLQTRGAAVERIRIARDLHDRIGQSMAYVVLELDRLRSAADDPELQEELNQLRENARSMLRELRETLSDLRTEVTEDQNLQQTIAVYLKRVEKRSQLSTTLDVDGYSNELGLGEERELWRIAQEAINNTERHAQATTLKVRLALDNSIFILEVEDNGIGIAAQAPSQSGAENPSYGVTGMRERSSMLGASIEVTAGTQGGTLVTVLLPLDLSEKARESSEPWRRNVQSIKLRTGAESVDQ